MTSVAASGPAWMRLFKDTLPVAAAALNTTRVFVVTFFLLAQLQSVANTSTLRLDYHPTALFSMYVTFLLVLPKNVPIGFC